MIITMTREMAAKRISKMLYERRAAALTLTGMGYPADELMEDIQALKLALGDFPVITEFEKELGKPGHLEEIINGYAQLEETATALQAVSGHTPDKLIELFLQGYTLTEPSGG